MKSKQYANGKQQNARPDVAKKKKTGIHRGICHFNSVFQNTTSGRMKMDKNKRKSSNTCLIIYSLFCFPTAASSLPNLLACFQLECFKTSLSLCSSEPWACEESQLQDCSKCYKCSDSHSYSHGFV